MSLTPRSLSCVQYRSPSHTDSIKHHQNHQSQIDHAFLQPRGPHGSFNAHSLQRRPASTIQRWRSRPCPWTIQRPASRPSPPLRYSWWTHSCWPNRNRHQRRSCLPYWRFPNRPHTLRHSNKGISRASCTHRHCRRLPTRETIRRSSRRWAEEAVASLQAQASQAIWQRTDASSVPYWWSSAQWYSGPSCRSPYWRSIPSWPYWVLNAAVRQRKNVL